MNRAFPTEDFFVFFESGSVHHGGGYECNSNIVGDPMSGTNSASVSVTFRGRDRGARQRHTQTGFIQVPGADSGKQARHAALAHEFAKELAKLDPQPVRTSEAA